MGAAQITSATLRAALDTIARWRMAPHEPVPCPVCAAAGLVISDHSARPHAEWYRLVCRSCGLDQMLSVPLGAKVPGGEG